MTGYENNDAETQEGVVNTPANQYAPIDNQERASNVSEPNRATSARRDIPGREVAPSDNEDLSHGAAGQGAGRQGFNENPAPIPAQNSPYENKAPEGEWIFRPRQDRGEIQPAPHVNYRSIVEPAPVELPEAAKTAEAGHRGVAPVPAGGLRELARLAYGDENRALDIYNANRDIMTSPDAHTIGHTVVRLPD